MAVNCFTHRLSSVTHGAYAHPGPTGGGINESVGFVESQAGGVLVPQIALSRVSATCSVTFQGIKTPQAKSTALATVTYTMQDDAGSSITVAIAKMVPDATSFTFSGSPYEQTINYMYKGASTETDPITVSG